MKQMIVIAQDDVERETKRDYDKWKLPTPSFMAIRNFSLITAFEEYSGNFKQFTHVITLGRQSSAVKGASCGFLTTVKGGLRPRKPKRRVMSHDEEVTNG